MVNGILPAGYVQTVNFAQPNSAPSPSDTASSSGNKAGDSVTISEEAKVLQLSSLFPSAGNGSITLEDIEESLSNATASVEKRLQSLYRQIGIDSGSRMELSVNRDGSIAVDGKSPESDALAEAINADDELANTIRGMSANASLLAAAEKHQEFASAYGTDPVAAVERYGYLLQDGHGYHAAFAMQNGHIDTEVDFI